MIAKNPNALGTASSRPKFFKDLVQQWSRKIEQEVNGKTFTFLAYKNVERPKDEPPLLCTTDKTRAITDFDIKPKRKNT